jgi:hypothetical protein
VNPLISPCGCAGSLKWVHLGCLRTWLARKENVKTSPLVTSYSWKAFHCELCKNHYKDPVTVEDQYGYSEEQESQDLQNLGESSTKKNNLNRNKKNKKREFWLFEIQKPKTNYVVLESIQLSSNSNNNNHNQA